MALSIRKAVKSLTPDVAIRYVAWFCEYGIVEISSLYSSSMNQVRQRTGVAGFHTSDSCENVKTKMRENWKANDDRWKLTAMRC
jgi:hypothetical protein